MGHCELGCGGLSISTFFKIVTYLFVPFMSKKQRKSSSIWLWIIIYIVIAFALYVALRDYILQENAVVDWLSVYGVYTTIFSLVLMFVQFRSIREVSEETKSKLNKTIAISNLSKYSELIRSVEFDVRKDNFDVALYKTQDIKEIVHKIKILEQNGGTKVDDEFEPIFSILATHINSYNERLLSAESELNKSVILTELEDVSSFFQRKSNEMINNIQ